MALVLVATVGGASSNSYCTVADADTYYESRLHATTWVDDTDTDDKTIALVQATRLLDQWYRWHGTAASGDQALLWPRIGVVGANGYLIASDTLPTGLVHATAELAGYLVEDDRTAESDTQVQGLKRLKTGSLELEFTGLGGPRPIPDAVRMFLRDLGVLERASSGNVQLYRA